MDEKNYQFLLRKLRNSMKDARVVLSPKTDPITFVPLQLNTAYYGSVILDIFYSDA
jgi:hypothetical protein